jgi:oligopeptide transport system permease protein
MRLMGAVLVIWVIMTLSFFLMRMAPGGPFDADRRLPAAVEQNLWNTYGMAEMIHADGEGIVSEVLVSRDTEVKKGDSLVRLMDGTELKANRDGELLGIHLVVGESVKKDQPIGATKTPLWQQYTSSIWNYMQLDFGQSMSYPDRTVYELIAQTFPVSAELGLMALAFALFFGVGVGVVAGLRANTWVDYTTMSVAMIGVSLSAIVLGPLLILVFGVELQWVDYGGWDSWEVKILPVLTLGLIYAAYFARLTRGGVLEVVSQDYIRTARAKGLNERQLLFRHVFKGAILPVVTFLGPAVAAILCGSVVVERVFGIAGVSEFFVQGAINRDYTLVMGVVVLFSSLLVVMNLLVDLAYTFLDPRVTVD